jgi:2-methylcitrate dehydratase
LPCQRDRYRENVPLGVHAAVQGHRARCYYQAKRFLLDSLGCALGGYQQHDVTIALEVLSEVAGRGLATVFGSGRRFDPVSASLANALMIRCMDYNDIYWKQDPSHPSDIFPAAIACCERARSGGKELIVGLVLGHEFEMRFCEAAFPESASAAGIMPR